MPLPIYSTDPQDEKQTLWMCQLALSATNPQFCNILFEEMLAQCKIDGLGINMQLNTFDSKFWFNLRQRISQRFDIVVNQICDDRYKRAVSRQIASGWGVSYGPQSDITVPVSIKEMK